jgi:hypothetical protein
MEYPKVEIRMRPESPSVHGTQIFIDGVEQKMVRKAVLELEAGKVAKLSLEVFGVTHFEGSAEVDRKEICAACHNLLKEVPGV